MLKLLAKLILKILPKKKEVIDPYPPRMEGESIVDYNKRVPVVLQEVMPPVLISYLRKPR